MSSDDIDGEENVGLAFGLTIGAGLCTTIGALVPYVSDVRNTKILGGGLGISSGVMLYVSFVEIYQKSVIGFTDHFVNEECKSLEGCDACDDTCEGFDQEFVDRASAWATAGCFFGGILLTILLDRLVHLLDGGAHSHDIAEALGLDEDGNPLPSHDNATTAKADIDVSKPVVVDKHIVDQFGRPTPTSLYYGSGDETGTPATEATIAAAAAAYEEKDLEAAKAEHHLPNREELKKMGLVTALAIGIHNFPEGLATFVATLADESLGIALAIAIAIHNVPEGVCVSVPVYYATGSRAKAFWWSFISGISEPIGALLGYLVLREVFDDVVYGVLFGIVAGMMVWIVVKELIPTGLRYDRLSHKSAFFPGMIFGMVIMALSLLLFL